MKYSPEIRADAAGGFRTVFQYRNPMYTLAGQIVPAVTNQSWDEFLAARIFQPLGMTRSLTRSSDRSGFANVAAAHVLNSNNVPVPVAFRDMDTGAQFGGVMSCARDMAQWVRLQLGNGLFNGERIVDADALATTRTPHVPIPGAAPPYEQLSYCLGWQSYTYERQTMFFHGGQIDGMSAHVELMPGLGVGVVVLQNVERYRGQYSPFGIAIGYRVFDGYLGVTNTDWNGPMLTNAAQADANNAALWRDLEATRNTNYPTSLPLAGYATSYVSDVYGQVQVTLENDHLVYRHSAIAVYDLEHWSNDTFIAIGRNLADTLRAWPLFLSFNVAGGSVTSMTDDMFNYVPRERAAPGGVPVLGDYDGDRTTDLAYYQEFTGNWYVWLSSAGNWLVTVPFGDSGWTAAPGDYDGDGRHDLVIYREAIGTWSARLSSSGYASVVLALGGNGGWAEPADYDGDGKTDPAVYWTQTGYWDVLLSGAGYPRVSMLFGGPGYSASVMDLDGDGRGDPMLYYPYGGHWFALLSAHGYTMVEWSEYNTQAGGGLRGGPHS